MSGIISKSSQPVPKRVCELNPLFNNAGAERVTATSINVLPRALKHMQRVIAHQPSKLSRFAPDHS